LLNYIDIQSNPNIVRNQSEYSHRQNMVDEGTSKTRFEFGKYSTFEDTPKNLLVTADKECGSIVLWH
jgi:hypothetical protein